MLQVKEMSLVVWCICWIVCFQQIDASKAGTCGGHYFPQVGKNLTVTMGSEKKQYKPSLNCLWTFIGDGVCKPAIACRHVDLRPSKCDTEHVRITDGIGGAIDSCESDNKVGSNSYVASRGGRDLYVEFKSDMSNIFKPATKGFLCEVFCDNPEKSIELPPDERIRKEGRCVCGIKQGNEDRIVNGVNADPFEFPWLAAVVKNGTRKSICGGSIINNKFILTAAHCFGFSTNKPGTYEILLHAQLLSIQLLAGLDKKVEAGQKGSIKYSGWNEESKTDEDEHSLRFKIEDIIIHSEFSKSYDYDVALVKVEGTIPILIEESHNLVPICLPRAGNYDSKYIGEQATVAGWGLGQHDAGATTRRLQKLVVPIIDLEDCKNWLKSEKKISPRMMCAGFKEGQKDACQGDSGGPLIIKKNKFQYTQIGIVSWGESCAQEKRPGFYSRVTELVQWVQYHANHDHPTWCANEL